LVETIERIDLPTATRERYLRYALSVITSRALPDVRDGLKPVQRRILYCMENDLHLRSTARHVKSARVVGDVMGKYHPHSDTALYDAMVRMAQPFSLRYPLVQGQGNFGAITGDSAAAMRYTEARLAPLASRLMESLSEETVPTRPTYDETRSEPEVLPAPVPLLLLNGSTGIAVGMATNIPPHNLREVVKATISLIDDRDAPVAKLLRSIKGPDFPTGGELVTDRESLLKIYETGRGTVKVRGTYKVEDITSKSQRVTRQALVINSVPYGSSTAQILAKVKELVDGKKLPQVTHASDQTTEKEGVRIVLELRPGSDPDLIMAAVYRLSPLESTYGVNLTCLLPTVPGLPCRPAQSSLKEILEAWLDFRFDVVTRSLEYQRARLLERIHILEGLAKVLGSIDAAIKLVRSARDKADARAKLTKRFALSELQANAVLEIQLYRLAKLEIKKVEDELAEKRKEVKRLTKLLKGPKPRWDLIKKELEGYAKDHASDRRQTKVVLGQDELDYDPTALITREDAFVVVSRDGRLKRQKGYPDLDKLRMREDDELLAIVQGSTTQPVALFTNHGSAYVMMINDVPATAGFGDPVQKFFSFADGERLVGVLSLDPRAWDSGAPPDAELFVATAGGNVLRAPLAAHLETSTRSGRKFVRLDKGDEVVSVEGPPPPNEVTGEVLLASQKGMAHRFKLAEVPELSGVGKGRRGIKLAKKDRLVAGSLRGRLLLETTRGSEDSLKRGKVTLGAIGAQGVVIKQRGGWRRQLPFAPLLADELEPDGEEG
jgi:DNA gyrase subunit A